MEVIGYIGRAEVHENTDQLMPYILQSMFLLLLPVFFAASIYMVLGRIIRVARGEKYSLIPFTIITKPSFGVMLFHFWYKAQALA